MSEMVKRVAKALYDIYAENVPANLPYEQIGPHGQAVAEKMARAAISAMREPGPAVIRAGQDEIAFHVPDTGNPCRPHPHASAEAWHAMIDVALKD